MSLSIGDHGNAVRRLQQQLKSEGFDPGGIDGKFGARTREAVLAFQRRHGLRADGAVGEDTSAALRRALVDTDDFQPGPSTRTGGVSGRAEFERIVMEGRRRQRADGTITVNGNSYDFRSGGFGKGNLPAGTYTVRAHMWHRTNRSMNVGGVGYSFAVSDKFDSRVGATRRLLRIHPDGGQIGTEGCIGIVGNADVQRRFREDMRAELRRNGGSYQLVVG